MPVVALTPAFLASKAVCPPGKKQIEYCDSIIPGLVLECRAAAGSVPTWRWRHKVDGKTKYRRLGSLADLEGDHARKQVALLKAEHAMLTTRVPADEQVKGNMTLDLFMRHHYFPYAQLHKRSFKRDDQLYRIRIAPKFGSLQLNQITRHEVQTFHSSLVSVEKLSPASADLHIALLRHVLNLAVEWGMLGGNVLKGFKLLLVDNRVDNYLVEEEVERLKNVLLADRNRPVCMAILWLTVTGARLSSGLHCRWKDIDMANKMWVVPSARAKSKKPNPHFLNDSALWILRQLAGRTDSEYVFANPKTGKPYTTITRVWYRIRKKAKVNPKARLHDLRHSWAHRILAAGHSVTELQFAMHHSDPRTTMKYSHASPRMMRQVAGAAALQLPEAAQPMVIDAEVKLISCTTQAANQVDNGVARFG